MKAVAFVFARGGSKGLPGKNIRPLGGLPLLAHSIRVAQQIPEVARVYVSTDADDIAAVARQYGAEVIRRPAELAGDAAPEWEAWRHAIREVRAAGEDFDVFLSLPATSPLRSVDDVRACLAALDAGTDAVITVTPAASNPWFNMAVRDAGGVTRIACASEGFVRRQDAPDVYDITAVAFVTRPDFVLTHDRLFAGRVRSVVVPRERGVDIDDLFDFRMAELLFDPAPDSPAEGQPAAGAGGAPA